MSEKIIMTGAFVAITFAVCLIWNYFVSRYYKSKEQVEIKQNLQFDFAYDTLPLAGEADDENSDIKIIKAIELINMPENVRIEL